MSGPEESTLLAMIAVETTAEIIPVGEILVAQTGSRHTHWKSSRSEYLKSILRHAQGHHRMGKDLLALRSVKTQNMQSSPAAASHKDVLL